MTCPGAESLAQIAEGTLPRDEQETLLAHLADCDDCRHAVLALASERHATARRVFVRRTGFPWAAAAAILLLAGAVYVGWRNLPRPVGSQEIAVTPEPTAQPTPSPEPEPPSPMPPSPAPTPAPQVPETPSPQPSPEPAPAPVPQTPSLEPTPTPRPGPTQVETPAPTPTPEPTPKRELVAVRLLDVTGELAIAKKRVSEGQMTREPVTATTGGAFRVNGDLVSLLKGTVATVGTSEGVLCLSVAAGEACIESDGATWRLGEREVTLKGRAIVSPSATVMLADVPEKEAAKRVAPHRALQPRQRTWLFEDFAGRPGGIGVGTPGMGLVQFLVDLPKPAPYGRKLAVRLRYRTNAPTLQVAMHFQGDPGPWAAMNATKRGAWQEITVPVTRFDSGPSGEPEPQAGAPVTGLRFTVNQAEVGRERASLEIDDVVLLERE